MANCCSTDRLYMGTGRSFVRQTSRESDGCGRSSAASFRSPNGCEPESLCENLPLAMSYMAPPPYTGLVDAETALARGSAFNNLYRPWNSGSCGCQSLR